MRQTDMTDIPEGFALVSIKPTMRMTMAAASAGEEFGQIWAAMILAAPNRAESAVTTLSGLGYTWHGGQEWKPPLGKRPEYLEPGLLLQVGYPIGADGELRS
jgi:hypothetical protein